MTAYEKTVTEKLAEQFPTLDDKRQQELSRIMDAVVLVSGAYEKAHKAVAKEKRHIKSRR
ncbi:MAG: hypothetical protein IJ428_01190 [Clostridia bacterium]|nr:hypothetical protein [Clostridia bacterium]